LRLRWQLDGIRGNNNRHKKTRLPCLVRALLGTDWTNGLMIGTSVSGWLDIANHAVDIAGLLDLPAFDQLNQLGEIPKAFTVSRLRKPSTGKPLAFW
jgi:hypothetical protein